MDPTDFINMGFQRDVQRLAHKGEASLFDYGQGKNTQVEASRLRIMQGDPGGWRDGRDLIVVDLYENGTLSVSLNVTGLTGGDAMRDVGQTYRIDPNDVRRRLEGAWGLDPNDISRRLEVAPQQPVSSTSIPAACPRDPLWICDRQRRIVRQDLRKPEGEIKRTLDMMQLRFKDWEGRPF